METTVMKTTVTVGTVMLCDVNHLCVSLGAAQWAMERRKLLKIVYDSLP